MSQQQHHLHQEQRLRQRQEFADRANLSRVERKENMKRNMNSAKMKPIEQDPRHRESLILEDRVLIEHQARETSAISLPEELAEEARDWWYYDDISGKEFLSEKFERVSKKR